MEKYLKPELGKMYGNYKVISNEVFKIKDKNREHYRGHLKVECTLCNTEHLIRSDILNKNQATKCRACSNKEKYLKNVQNKVIAFKGYSIKHQGTGDLTKTQLLRIKNSCNKRKIEWDDNYITTQNMWSLMLSQNHKCALSGLDIWLSKGKNVPMQTNQRNLDYSGWNASLDRIDSSKGYIKGNVQWVHRNVNIMKNSYTEDYFLYLCKEIINHANQQPNLESV